MQKVERHGYFQGTREAPHEAPRWEFSKHVHLQHARIVHVASHLPIVGPRHGDKHRVITTHDACGRRFDARLTCSSIHSCTKDALSLSRYHRACNE
jgi:hypothetical protein